MKREKSEEYRTRRFRAQWWSHYTQTETEHPWRASLLQSPDLRSRSQWKEQGSGLPGSNARGIWGTLPAEIAGSALSGSGASWPPGGALCWNPAKSYEICWVQLLVPHTRSNWCCEIHSVRELNARETSGQEPVQGKSLEVKCLFFLCCSTSNLWPSSKSHPPTKYKYLKSPALFSEEEKRVHLELR